MNIKKIQQEVFCIFKQFTKICEQHNLKYYLLGGTMLGAIRHRGFIPWDDDMDVGMPRNDYNKLLSLKKEFSQNKILNSYENTNCSYDFTKIMKNVLDEQGNTVEIFLDIFPLDGCPNRTKRGIRSYWRKFDFLRMQKNSHFISLENKGVFKKCIIKILRKKKLSCYLKKMNLFLEKHTFENSFSVGNFSGHWEDKEIMEKEIYGEPTLVFFEDGYYYGVEQPHKYLTNLYGDYMKVPDEKDRIGHF